MNSVKEMVQQQYIRQSESAAAQVAELSVPSEGWLKQMRKSLGMSASSLARRIAITKPAVYQTERKELEGGVTIRQMQKFAQAMGGRFVYAVVPNNPIEETMRACARKKAKAIVDRVNIHMALEKQEVSSEQSERTVERIADELIRTMPRDFWDDVR